ncbi:MAG: hypothetical protein QM703_11010 [Gemmatales bacterium]
MKQRPRTRRSEERTQGDILATMKSKKRIEAKKKRLVFAAVSFPYVVAALICEKVLKEEDGVASPMRIVDTLNLNKSATESLDSNHLIRPQLQMFLSLRAARPTKDLMIEVWNITPRGRRDKFGVSEFKFSERPTGHSITAVFPVHIRWDGEGLYWFDITVNGHTLTRAALHINLEAINNGVGTGKADILLIEKIEAPVLL